LRAWPYQAEIGYYKNESVVTIGNRFSSWFSYARLDDIPK